jgi:hypothetical protein
MSENEKVIVHGVPGDRARGRGILRMLWPLMAAVFACGFLSGAALSLYGICIGGRVIGFAFLAVAVALVLAARSGVGALVSFFKGARGEERVAAVLGELPGGWQVFHDLGCVPGGIDHVAVGEGGAFAIETKCWSGDVTIGADGALLVDGKRPSRPPLAQAESSAAALGAYLAGRMEDAPEVKAVLCFASGTFKPGLARCGRVTVCNVAGLPDVLKTGGPRLAREQVGRVAKVLELKEEI